MFCLAKITICRGLRQARVAIPGGVLRGSFATRAGVEAPWRIARRMPLGLFRAETMGGAAAVWAHERTQGVGRNPW